MANVVRMSPRSGVKPAPRRSTEAQKKAAAKKVDQKWSPKAEKKAARFDLEKINEADAQRVKVEGGPFFTEYQQGIETIRDGLSKINGYRMLLGWAKDTDYLAAIGSSAATIDRGQAAVKGLQGRFNDQYKAFITASGHVGFSLESMLMKIDDPFEFTPLLAQIQNRLGKAPTSVNDTIQQLKTSAAPMAKLGERIKAEHRGLDALEAPRLEAETKLNAALIDINKKRPVSPEAKQALEVFVAALEQSARRP